jgi:hypothetical protein
MYLARGDGLRDLLRFLLSYRMVIPESPEIEIRDLLKAKLVKNQPLLGWLANDGLACLAVS